MVIMLLREERSYDFTPYGTLNIYLFVCLFYYNMVTKRMKAAEIKAVLKSYSLKTVQSLPR